MSTRYFALVIGILYLLVGVAGFVPGLYTMPPPDAPSLAVDGGYGYLFGLFPVNILHNLVHLAIGALGVLAYRSLPGAIRFSRGLAIFYGVLTVMGLFPVLQTTFGLMPLFSHDVWLHGVTMLAAVYFGWLARPAGRDIAARPTAAAHP
jgi:hypothetical protein